MLTEFRPLKIVASWEDQCSIVRDPLFIEYMTYFVATYHDLHKRYSSYTPKVLYVSTRKKVDSAGKERLHMIVTDGYLTFESIVQDACERFCEYLRSGEDSDALASTDMLAVHPYRDLPWSEMNALHNRAYLQTNYFCKVAAATAWLRMGGWPALHAWDTPDGVRSRISLTAEHPEVPLG